MSKLSRYEITKISHKILPNIWDIAILIFVFSLLTILVWIMSQMNAPFEPNQTLEISTNPSMLPQYALKSVFRMFIALCFSLLFTFTVAPLAAKNRHFERLIIPFIDIMESIPIIGILAVSVAVFIYLFPNSLLGPECASIFVIFTSQVWNMTLSLYQSLRTVPSELKAVAKAFHLSGWQQFWRIEVPHAMPNLLWNTMMSMSAGWFFVVESEAISVAHKNITLPGIGSYVAKAILDANLQAIFYALVAMFVVILIYDQLFFRPLLSWVEKFKPETSPDKDESESWFFNLLAKTHLLRYTENLMSFCFDLFINHFPFSRKTYRKRFFEPVKKPLKLFLIFCFYILFTLLVLNCVFFLLDHVASIISLLELLKVFYLGFITGLKVFCLIFLASVFWVPIGVWIGLNKKISYILQPVTQILAAFPANLFYPIFVVIILKYHLNTTVWTMPLMILGTQWYILFNVIAASSAIPKEVMFAAKNFGVKPWSFIWWKRLMLPALFPSYITGAMAAAGGCWNASIVAEVVSWGDTTLEATGLGQYIVTQTLEGDYSRLALGISVMSSYVIVINRLLWHRLYNLAESRFSLE